MPDKKHESSEQPHWGYTGAISPENWGRLCPEFSLCGTGKNQAPINLTGFVKTDLPPLQLDYQVGGVQIVNNGHCIQINILPGSTLSIEGHSFELKQYHFHAPSENHINGQPYPMESHFVHADDQGNLAVVAVMYVLGDENAAIAQAWSHMPENPGSSIALSSPIPFTALLPTSFAYYRFNGSLTTPPCTEGVCWFVMKEPVTVSQDQIDYFARVMGCQNNRPVQPLNARLVLA